VKPAERNPWLKHPRKALPLSTPFVSVVKQHLACAGGAEVLEITVSQVSTGLDRRVHRQHQT
jgi:hypothetical protein